MNLQFVDLVVDPYGGGFVSGWLQVACSTPTKCDGIDVTLRIHAIARMNEGQIDMMGNRIETDLMRHIVTVWGQPTGGSSFSHEAGTHRYAFAFFLPMGTVPSLVVGPGQIVCELAAHARRGLLSRDSRAATTVALRGSNNTAAMARFSGAVERVDSKAFMFSSGAVEQRVQLLSALVWPGGQLRGSVRIVNSSSKTVAGVSVKFLQVARVEIRRSNHTATRTEAVKRVLLNAVVPAGETRELPFDIDVPAGTSAFLPSVRSGTGGLVTIEHFLVVRSRAAFAMPLETRVAVHLAPLPRLKTLPPVPVHAPVPPVFVHDSLTPVLLEAAEAQAPAAAAVFLPPEAPHPPLSL